MINSDKNLVCDHCGKLLLAAQYMPTFDDQTGEMFELCLDCFCELKSRIERFENARKTKIHEYLTVQRGKANANN